MARCLIPVKLLPYSFDNLNSIPRTYIGGRELVTHIHTHTSMHTNTELQ